MSMYQHKEIYENVSKFTKKSVRNQYIISYNPEKQHCSTQSM